MNLDEYNWIEESERAHRSVSQLTSYASCSEAHRLSRIAKVPQLEAAWFVQGDACHKAIERWEQDRSISLEELEVFYVDSYVTEANKRLAVTPDQGLWLTGGNAKGFDDLTERQDRGWLQVLQYTEYARAEEHLWRVIDVEREFLVHFGDVPVRGFIDQIVEWADGTVEPRDIKSGTKTPSSAVQLITYAIAIERVVGIKVRGASFVKLANPKGRTEKTRSTQYLDVNLADEAAYINPGFLNQFYRDADRGIEAGIFIPNPTDGCERVCGVRQWCRDRGVASSAAQRQEGLIPLEAL